MSTSPFRARQRPVSVPIEPRPPGDNSSAGPGYAVTRWLLLSLLLVGLLGGSRLALGRPLGEGENFPGPTRPPEKERSSLRQSLFERLQRDQDVRRKYLEDGQDVALREEMDRVDRENSEWMKGLVQENGWPRISEVGADGAQAAFLLVQHSPDAAFQRRCLDLMTPLVKEGEVSAVNWAYLLDRVLLAEGKKQVFGTQFLVGPDGKPELRPLEDPETVDSRRAELGLPPLEEYRKLVEDMHRQRKTP